jgi:hypothetical protein
MWLKHSETALASSFSFYCSFRGSFYNAVNIRTIKYRCDPIPTLACYLLAHLHRLFPSPLYWFPMRSTIPLFLFLYSWVFPTGDSVCSHLHTLVPSSRIFLPWRWRRYVPPKRRFTQYLHGATSPKTTFFNWKRLEREWSSLNVILFRNFAWNDWTPIR